MKDVIHIIQNHWIGKMDFCKAQLQVIVVLIIAYIGNNFEPSYSRNENHNPSMFWFMNIMFLAVALLTLKHEPNTRSGTVQLLSRKQTEEWKGWMQWAFIMYHYYRAYFVYNEIRVFVSAYVWMTGFGNFLYFDKKADFSLERAISMWLRINYFPLLLSLVVGVPFDLFYIVPLHTTAFFITMATCYVSKLLEQYGNTTNNFLSSWSSWHRNAMAIVLCVIVHIVFYETPLVDFLLLFGKEIHFRFQSDKYSGMVGIVSGFFWSQFQKLLQRCHIPRNTDDGSYTMNQQLAAWGQRIMGLTLLALWWFLFGRITDKFTYNPIHPFIFWMPIAGWLMLRNSSKYLTELHSTSMEFFGRITLETYVLQFHLFMNHNVQHIPQVLPGSGPDGHALVKFSNMLLCGCIFVAVAYWARQITVTTQTTITDLLTLLRKGGPKQQDGLDVEGQETVALNKDSNRDIPADLSTGSHRSNSNAANTTENNAKLKSKQSNLSS